MSHGAGGSFRSQLELWPRTLRTGAFMLRFLDADGREADLDATELARSIMAAGSRGDDIDWDTALGVARAVVAFLRHSSEIEPFAFALVVRTVERALREMGYGRTARIFARDQVNAQTAPAESGGDSHRWNALLDAEAMQRSARAWIEIASADAPTFDDVAADIFARLDSLGLRTATPGFVREFVVSELLARGLHDWAERIAHLSVPIVDVEALHRGETKSDAEFDSSGEVAARLSTAYAIARVLPERVTAAHTRGDIQILGLDDVCRLERVALDLEGVKQIGTPDADDSGGPPPPLTDPTRLARLIATWTRTLAPHVTRGVRWNAVNFGYAPLLAQLDERDYVRAAYALLFELARTESRNTGPRVELEFVWDAPENIDVVHGIDGALVPAQEAYPGARAFFSAALDAIEALSSRQTPILFPDIRLTLSPYFFGAPEAPKRLDQISRTIANGFPLTLLYEPAVPLTLGGGHAHIHQVFVAQTVVVNLGRALRHAVGLNALLARVESATDDAVAAHLARHDQLAELARHRHGTLAPLGQSWVNGPLLDPRALRYRVAMDDSQGEFQDAERIDAVIEQMRTMCGRWSSGTGRAIELAGIRATHSEKPTGNARENLAVQSRLHPKFAVPAPCIVPRGPGVDTPTEIADFVRWAFLYTPCRALQFI